MHRYSEIDILRSLAVLGMIVYHGSYDLVDLYGYPWDLLHGGWLIFQRIIANIFLLLVGISFAISYARTDSSKIWKKFLKRGLILLLCGYLVSIATYIVDPETYVRFGVLHLIGISIMLLPFFAGLKNGNLVIAGFFYIFDFWTHIIIVHTSVLLPLGFTPPLFQTVDYFPLVPWFAVILVGLVIGQNFYVHNLEWRTYLLQFLKPITYNLKPRTPKILTFPGRYALIIYLLHQPILIGIMMMIWGMPQT